MSVEMKRRWAGEAVEERVPLTAFVEALSELMDGDDRVVALTSDLATVSGLSALEEEYEGRVINVGAARQSIIGIAAGMASMGKVPVVVTSGASIARTTPILNRIVAPGNLHMVIAGLPSGLAGHQDMAGHVLDDLASLSLIDGFRVLMPTDAEETAKGLITLVDDPGPGYLRLTNESTPVITGPDTPFDFGEPLLLREGTGVTIIASGPLVYQALVAADLLEDQGVDARVYAAHSLNPFSETAYAEAARETGAMVVCEEHAVSGGVGSRVALALGVHRPVPMEHIYVRTGDAGSAPNAALRKTLGLDAEAIAAAAGRVIAKKSA